MTSPRSKTVPVALTVAGSDSGGGAGIQADLKTFEALNVHGTSAITCLTAQNPKGVLAIEAVRPEMVARQIEAVFSELPPAAVKTGMLFSSGIIRVVAEFFRTRGRPPLIVDPVMVATSGAQLLQPSAVRALKNELLPLAALVTPNLQEAELLLALKISTPEDLRTAARALNAQFGCAALVKGGHLAGCEAVDIFNDGKTEMLLSAPRIRRVRTHGTGCTYSAAITAYLALGGELSRAVQPAKEYITQSIAQHRRTARHTMLNWRV